MVRLHNIKENIGTLMKPLKNIKNQVLFSEIYPQFQAKLPEYASVYKIRSKLKLEMQNYLLEEGFVNIDTPILTQFVRDASESAFFIESTRKLKKKESPVDFTFGHPVYLSTSGQLPLQCFLSGMSKVYNLGPAFYSGDTSGKHLNEFQKIDCEEAFLNGSAGFENVMERVEKLIKFVFKHLIEEYGDELNEFHNISERLEKINNAPFQKILYDDAVRILSNNQETLPNLVKYGMSIYRTGEKVLTEYFDGNPFFITDYPYYLKPFNAVCNEDSKTVKTFSLIFPGSSSVASGGLREFNHKETCKKLELFGGKEYYEWWLKSLEWGCASSGGFTLGIDRLMHIIMKDWHIRQVNPFPRAQNCCKL